MTQYITVDIYYTGGFSVNDGPNDERIVVPCKNGNITVDMIAKTDTVVFDYIEEKPKQVGYFGSIQSRFQIHGEKRPLGFGGRFIWSNDSRFREQYGDRPIPLHDNYVT